MMHRDEKVVDAWETLCSTDSMALKRFRMNSTPELKGLSSGQDEVLVVVMKGSAKVSLKSAKEPVELDEKDICYVPRDEGFSLAKDSDSSELIVASAPATTRHQPFVKRFVETTAIESGIAPYKRRIYNMVREADKADRFLGGFVEGDSGNWTSFPPHRHDGKPEVYVYYGMGAKFGVQMVISDEGDASYVVRDGDAVLFERGYHPNVAAPGTGMNFLWVISAPPDRRNLSAEYHPAFEGMQAGATHLKTEGSGKA